MNSNILSSVAIQINYRYKDELIMEIKEKTNEKVPEKVISKTTETLHQAVVFSFGPDEPNHYIIDEYLFQELVEHLKALDETL